MAIGRSLPNQITALARRARRALCARPMLGVVGAPSLLFLMASAAAGGVDLAALLAVAACLALAGFYVAGVAEDRRRTAEALARAEAEAAAAHAAKADLLARVSHELRGPAVQARDTAETLRRTRLDARQAEQVDKLVRWTGGLATVLGDLFDIAAIEAGALDLDQVAFAPDVLCRQACERWAATAQGKGLALVYEGDPHLPPWVAGDPRRIGQILDALVRNALTFTAEGHVRLEARALSGAQPGAARVEFVVADSGAGMSRTQQERLFQAYGQVEAAAARRFEGSGLGLASLRRLTELMGGCLSVESACGAGSVFRLALDLPLAEAPAQTTASAGLAGRRVLVVEDNRSNQALARAILESAGAAVVFADDGAEALDRLRGAPFDVVLMDVRMPRMDGLEAVGRIRAGEAGSSEVAVIALTADVGVEADRLRAAGFDAVEAKPVSPGALIAAVAQARPQPRRRRRTRPAA